MAKKEKSKVAIKKSNNKNGIGQQIQKQIGSSVTVVLAVIAVVTLLQMNNMGTTANDTELRMESEAAALQLEQYFSPFERMVEQQAVNTEIKSIINTTVAGQNITGNIKYSSVFNNLVEVKRLDDDNILATWIADIDANVLTQSDRYTSGADFDITTRPWFECTKTGKTILTDPYVDISTGQKILSVATPVVNAMGGAVGVSGMDVSLESMMQLMDNYKIGKEGYVMLVTGSGTFIYHPDASKVGTNIKDMNISKSLLNAIEGRAEGILKYKTDGQSKVGYLANVGETGYMVISCITNWEYNFAILSMLVMFIVIFAVGFLIIIISMRTAAARIVRPLGELNEAAMKLAEGDLDVELDVTSEDEVGELGRSIEKTVIRLKEYIDDIDEISEVVQENSATAEESAASCEQLNSQAIILRDKISVFRT